MPYVRDSFWRGRTFDSVAQMQDAAVKAGFDASYVALVVFPQVVSKMATEIEWTRQLGQAFAADRSVVFAAIQRLRKQAQDVGTLKTTAQQEVTTQDQAARTKLIEQIQAEEAKDLATVPFLQGSQVAVVGKNVSGTKDTLDPSFKFRYGVLSKG